MIAFDTECNGINFQHGSKPFFVTLFSEDSLRYWEWDINPLNREPIISERDIEEIRNILFSGNTLIAQNARFDIKALASIGIDGEWPWDLTNDTLVAGHVIASGQKHNLTAMAMIYCGIDIEPLELALKEACIEARKIAKKQFPTWRIAAEGLPEMPSCDSDGESEEKPWAFDMWLPRAIAKKLNYPKDHTWWTVLSDYSNADSEVTMYVWKEQEKILKERDLWTIYQTMMKSAPVHAGIESGGLTGSMERLESVQSKLESEATVNECVCVSLSEGQLDRMPDGLTNALRDLIFNKFGLVSNKDTAKGNPSMDKYVLDYWISTLPDTSQARAFIKNLSGYRKRKTALGYIDSYKKFLLPIGAAAVCSQNELSDFWKIYCSLNGTGTGTTRYSCSNPNLQQISKQDEVNLREIFGPGPGREWWSLDARNIEKRIPAYEAKEESLIELFERPTEPPFYGSEYLFSFSTIYPDVWGKAVKEVGLDKAGPYCKKTYESTWYKWCKTGILAMGYQAGEATADRTFHRPGCYKLLKRNLPRLEAHNRWCVDFANKHGYIETIPDRTVNPNHGYPLECSRGGSYGRIKPTIPLAYRTQGSAGWWMRRAMIEVQRQKLDRWRRETGFDGRIALTVHDELVFDFPKVGDPVSEHNRLTCFPKIAHFRTSNLWRIRQIQKVMESIGDDFITRSGRGVPTPVSVEFHSNNWGEGVSM